MDIGLIKFVGIFVYLLLAAFIALEAIERGYGFWRPFFYSLLFSPLIGAILFSHYKPKE